MGRETTSRKEAYFGQCRSTSNFDFSLRYQEKWLSLAIPWNNDILKSIMIEFGPYQVSKSTFYKEKKSISQKQTCVVANHYVRTLSLIEFQPDILHFAQI